MDLVVERLIRIKYDGCVSTSSGFPHDLGDDNLCPNNNYIRRRFWITPIFRDKSHSSGKTLGQSHQQHPKYLNEMFNQFNISYFSLGSCYDNVYNCIWYCYAYTYFRFRSFDHSEFAMKTAVPHVG